jgi:hypothetical protein
VQSMSLSILESIGFDDIAIGFGLGLFGTLRNFKLWNRAFSSTELIQKFHL